jgi:hypothetical protein
MKEHMMRRLSLLAIAVAALTVVGTASGKGPIAATIDGPGTGGGITLGGSGEPGSDVPLGNFADHAGFSPAVFSQTPDPMLDSSPSSDLGPRYTVTYDVPGPNGREDRLVQDLYPYATGGPVTFTKPGQSLFGSVRTRGGWFEAPPALMDTLVEIGLPRTAPTGSPAGDGLTFSDVWLPAVLAFALVLAALGALIVRRRPRTATT